MSNDYTKIDLNKKDAFTPSVFFPHDYKEIDGILLALENEHPVIVNFTHLEDTKKYRMLDFLSGYIYGTNGKREKLEDNIFMFKR